VIPGRHISPGLGDNETQTCI